MGLSKEEYLDRLREMDFVCIAGYTERRKGVPTEVGLLDPPRRCWNWNMGVTVVYTEDGIPWAKPGKLRVGDLMFLGLSHQENGLDVPCSNDGGSFRNHDWPVLRDLQREGVL